MNPTFFIVVLIIPLIFMLEERESEGDTIEKEKQNIRNKILTRWYDKNAINDDEYFLWNEQ